MSSYDNGYEIMVERAWDAYCGKESDEMTLEEVMAEVNSAKSVKEAIELYEKYSEYMESAPDLKVEVWGENDMIESAYSWQYDGNHEGFINDWFDEGDDVIIQFVVE